MMSAPPPPSSGPEIDVEKLGQMVACWSETIYRSNGVWEGPDPLTPIIPFFLLQITVALLASRLLNFALKPFNQPPIVAEILSGIVLGPSVFGRIDGLRRLLFPNYHFEVLETMAHFALVFYAFITGLQMEIKPMWQATGTKSKVVAFSGTLCPFLIGTILFFSLPNEADNWSGFIYCGGALTITGFSVLAKILDSQKALHTDIGKVALSSSVINDGLSWVFLAIGLMATGSSSNFPWAVLCSVVYMIFSTQYLRPTLQWIVQKKSEGQGGYSEFYICATLVGMSVSGCVMDAIGTHPMVGAFVFGLIMPADLLGNEILNRLEDFVMGILMPVFYVVCGLRTNIGTMREGGTSLAMALALIALACSAKIVSALVASCFTGGMTAKEAIGVGMLTNTKSVMVMVILEVGQLEQVLTTQAYTIMVIASLVMTMVVTPMTALFCPSQNSEPYKRRTIQKAKPEDELRIMACIYDSINVPGVISLLESSNPTKASPITVFGIQVLEVVGRAPMMLVVHTLGSGRHAATSVGHKNLTHEEAQTNQIISAFDNYELRSEGVSTQVLTARSTFSTMAEDICRIAKEKRATLIILPFHKQQRGDDGEDETILNPAIQSVNEEVLASAPCSVGILVQRRGGRSEPSRNIAMLYLGGPDDREALMYARRMSGHTDDVHLTVIRFIPGKDAVEAAEKAGGFVTIGIADDVEREKLADEEFLNGFKTETAENPTITFVELVLEDEEEFTKALKSLDHRNHDLYVVGRGRGVGSSPLTSGLADWCECPEIGAVGDLLVTSEFESSFSVLVVQQYARTNGSAAGSIISAESMSQRMDADMQMDMGFRLSFADIDGIYDSSGSSFTRRPDHHFV
ncbi:unnamed protein product [Cuscuta epithymum]|uniref:Cation/H+ exchanger domain-containing protein n=1 Tax=Cuscuta epithymum TaxID=186058 RepID=A0AAV0CKK0_9ASTE|nr:unnamed protein product [Cuscuta epithymum]